MITLQPITAANWVTCIELAPTEMQQQQQFVATNVLSLAQAYAEPWWITRAIYAGTTMVGFLLYGRWPAAGVPAHHGSVEPGTDYILRFMVDGRYQGRGYGRAALDALITQLKADPHTWVIDVDYEPENTVAARLFTSLGFRPTGIIDPMSGEMRARLFIRDKI